MAKQEEIREGIAKQLCEIDLLFCGKNWEDIPEESRPSEKDRNYYRRQAVGFLNYLHSQGVVIKASEEDLDIGNAVVAAVEPLIKEEE